MSETFAKRLSLALHHAGMTQQELADALAVRPATVSAWMQTDGPLPKGDQLIRMPGLLNVSGHWLLTGNGPMRDPGGDALIRLDVIGRIADGAITVDQFASISDYVNELQAAIEQRAVAAAFGDDPSLKKQAKRPRAKKNG